MHPDGSHTPTLAFFYGGCSYFTRRPPPVVLAEGKPLAGFPRPISAARHIPSVPAPFPASNSAAGNRIATCKQLEPLKALKHLHSLDLEGCPLADMPEYRAHVFEELPSLTSVDEHNKNGAGSWHRLPAGDWGLQRAAGTLHGGAGQARGPTAGRPRRPPFKPIPSLCRSPLQMRW